MTSRGAPAEEVDDQRRGLSGLRFVLGQVQRGAAEEAKVVTGMATPWVKKNKKKTGSFCLFLETHFLLHPFTNGPLFELPNRNRHFLGSSFFLYCFLVGYPVFLTLNHMESAYKACKPHVACWYKSPSLTLSLVNHGCLKKKHACSFAPGA